jgi:hypothetical protein
MSCWTPVCAAVMCLLVGLGVVVHGLRPSRAALCHWGLLACVFCEVCACLRHQVCSQVACCRWLLLSWCGWLPAFAGNC